MSSVETNFNYRFEYFKNSIGQSDQNIDGSALPVDFYFDVQKKSYVRRIDFVIASTNIISTLDYGLISGGLMNGVDVIRSDPSQPESLIFNVKRFIEFGHFVDGQISQVHFMENPTENILIASVTLEPIMPLNEGTRFITRIRDNLSGLRYHRTSLLLLEP